MALVMSKMPDVWRKVLAEHLSDGTGRCRACRNADGETANWPCQTYRVAQEAKWVAEGNLPGTGPHGSGGPSATPRLSPLDDPRGAGPAYAGEPARPASTGGWDLPSSGGWDRPSTGGWDLPSSGDRLLPGSHGLDGPSWGAPFGGDDRPSTGGWDLPSYPSADPTPNDAATAFGGQGSSAPALASLPPLPPTATPAPAPSAPTPLPSWRDDPLGSSGPASDPWDDEPRRPSWASDESAPYGSRVDAPYGSTFGVDDRPRSSRH